MNKTVGLQPVPVARPHMAVQLCVRETLYATLARTGKMMSTVTRDLDALLKQLKEVSGRRIEGERRRRFLTQRQFATLVRMSVRWVREIESGNPVVKMDDHLRCAAALELAPSYIFLPLLYHSHGRLLPIDVLHMDLVDVERRYMRLIARRTERPCGR